MSANISDVRCATLSCCGVAATLAVVGLITMLVVGILGIANVIPMSPVGARVMVGISATIISSILVAALKSSCRSCE